MVGTFIKRVSFARPLRRTTTPHKAIIVLLQRAQNSFGQPGTDGRGKPDAPILADMKKTLRKLQREQLASKNDVRGVGSGQADISEGVQVHTCGSREENGCTHPCLLLSISRGATARIYEQVQISRSTARRSDWKLKSADCGSLGTNHRAWVWTHSQSGQTTLDRLKRQTMAFLHSA